MAPILGKCPNRLRNTLKTNGLFCRFGRFAQTAGYSPAGAVASAGTSTVFRTARQSNILAMYV